VTKLADEKILALFLMGLISSMGLASLRIPNVRSYWPADFQFSGSIEEANGTPLVSPFQFNNSTSDSMITAKFNPYVLPFMSSQMVRAARSFISVTGTIPTSSAGSFVAEWSGNSSGTQNYPTPFGWDIGDGTGNLTMTNGTIWVSPQTGFVTIYNLQNQSYSSDTSDMILVGLSQVQNAEWELNILANGTWAGLSDLQGVRVHQGTGIFAFQLGPSLRFKEPSITVTLSNPSSPGHIELSKIEFGHIENGGSILLTVNANNIGRVVVFPANLTTSLPLGKFETDFQFPYPFLLDGTNTMVIFATGGISWTLVAITLHVYVDTYKEVPQAWSGLPYPLFIYGILTTLLLVVSIWLLRRLLGWLQVATLVVQQETASGVNGIVRIEQGVGK